jgi:hypothetical protein
MSQISVDSFLTIKEQYEQEIAAYLKEKAAQFESDTGVNIHDIYVTTIDATAMGDGDKKFIISSTQIRTKLSD